MRRLSIDAALALLDEDPRVVAEISGDTHRHEIRPRFHEHGSMGLSALAADLRPSPRSVHHERVRDPALRPRANRPERASVAPPEPMEVYVMPERQFAWATHAPADYLLVFVTDTDGEHAVVHARFPDEDVARDAVAGLEGAELAGSEVRVYCTLPDEIERVSSRLIDDARADVAVQRGTVEFVAVGEGAARTAAPSPGAGGSTGLRVVASGGGDAPRCYRFNEQCSRCGEFLGSVSVLLRGGEMSDTRELRCRCQGIACRHCGTGTVRRPLSDHVDPERGAGHSPWFGYLVPCGACQAAGRGPSVL